MGPRARRENKLILFNIGAAGCHRCLRDSESHHTARIAEILNRGWICVEVDHDERPDINARYIAPCKIFPAGAAAVNRFLTPACDVFHGGTYFSPDGKYGRPVTTAEQLYEVLTR